MNPLISIIMATYQPNLLWLEQQLKSLDAQDYQPLELIVCDDASTPETYLAIQNCLQRCVTKFPFTLIRNEANLGSNGTFERLTLLAHGEWVSYCDQDDLWNAEKLSTLFKRTLTDKQAVLTYCDMCVVDENGKEIAKSLSDVRRRVRYHEGSELVPTLLYHNYISGCAMLMKTELAKQAVPFLPYIIYDHWLALWAAARGKIAFVPQALLGHRVHRSNQTNAVSDIHSKADYRQRRIELFLHRMEALSARTMLAPQQDKALCWARLRVRYAGGEYAVAGRLLLNGFGDPKVTIFELLLPLMPDRLFQKCIRGVQQGRL